MNNKLHNSIKRAGEEISLSHEERARMRRTLHSYMEMKPARVQYAGGPLRTPAFASVPALAWFFTLRPVAATLVLALFISSGGVSYAAESALPGDVLYPVKTRVNESVRGALARSGSAKVAWAMTVAGERVKEAATLAAEGRLSASTQQELQADFEQHAREATESIAETEASNPETSSETAVRFEAQLSEYENVLAQVGAAKDIDVASLTSSVKNEREHVAAVRARAESRLASTDTDDSATARMGIAARAHLETSARLARAVSESLSTSSSELVAVQLNDAGNAIAEGEDFAAQRSTRDARGAFRKALSATEKLGVFLQTSSDIHARTGLVVEEPKKSKRGKRSEERGDAQGISAAATISASALAPSSMIVTEASTSAEIGQSDEDGREKTEDENSDGQTLPVSVPVHLDF